LGHQLAGGLQAFADGRGVRPFADAALDGARTALAALEGKGDTSGEERRRVFRALRELDLGLLEDATLNELLVVSGAEQASEELMKVVVPLGQWLLAREGQP